MTQEWITVYAGSFSETLAHQATLEACGIPTIIPNETMKVVDPFITGANPLGAQIRVPMSFQVEAEDILSSRSPSADSERSDSERAAEYAEKIALAVRFCIVIPFIGWTIGAYFGYHYFKYCKCLPDMPRGHTTTIGLWIAQMAFMVLLTASLAFK